MASDTGEKTTTFKLRYLICGIALLLFLLSIFSYNRADLAVLDLNRPHVINSADFRSLGRATPFDGWGVSAAVALTLCGGEIAYHNLKTQEELP